MSPRQTAKTVIGVDVVLVVLLVLMLVTPVLDFRDYDSPPATDPDWQETVKRLDSFDVGAVDGTIVDARAIRTMRSAAPVRERIGGIGDYALSGQSADKAYFVHKKTGVLVVRSVGEELEGYKIRKIHENGVEFEKDGKIAELLF